MVSGWLRETGELQVEVVDFGIPRRLRVVMIYDYG